MPAQPPLPTTEWTLDLRAALRQHLIGRYILGRNLDVAPEGTPGGRWQEQFPGAYQNHPDVQHAGRSDAAIAKTTLTDLIKAILASGDTCPWFGLPA